MSSSAPVLVTGLVARQRRARVAAISRTRLRRGRPPARRRPRGRRRAHRAGDRPQSAACDRDRPHGASPRWRRRRAPGARSPDGALTRAPPGSVVCRRGAVQPAGARPRPDRVRGGDAFRGVFPRLRVPYPILLVLGGLASASCRGCRARAAARPRARRRAPVLLSGAFFTSLHELKVNVRPIVCSRSAS